MAIPIRRIRTQVATNKSTGAFFESLFVARCSINGLWAQKNPLAFAYRRGGSMQPIKANLDFNVFRRDGRLACIDTKAFSGTYVTRSQLDEAQIMRAHSYDDWAVPSGFVVHLRGCGQVFFFPAHIFSLTSRRGRYETKDAILLGDTLNFDPRFMFQ